MVIPQFQHRRPCIPEEVLEADMLPYPVHFADGGMLVPPTRASNVGEHTDEVLSDFAGYDGAKIKALREAGVAVVYAPFPLGWGLIFLACFCLFFNTGPVNTILANVTHPSLRAAGFALNIFVIHALGDAFVAALDTWPRVGVPEKPEAWLLAVAVVTATPFRG